MSANSDWRLFTGSGPADRDRMLASAPPLARLPAPPPWRDFTKRTHRARTYQASGPEIEMVNAALYLRRPLLITGKPGTGKSSLIYAVAEELALGPVLVWPITSRSTVRDGTYQYDAIGRLRDANIKHPEVSSEPENEVLSRYLSLGPLGTALLPGERPQALLIDEIDKADVDFPNDLLHVFEEGSFEIPEARRISKDFPEVKVRKGSARASSEPGEEDFTIIKNGRVQCTTFPFVVLTSNGERDMPAAFLRRCLRLHIEPPDETQLKKIVAAHFPEVAQGSLALEIDSLIQQVARDNQAKDKIIATDQLLSAIYLIRGEPSPQGEVRERIIAELLRELGQGQ